MCFGSGKVKDFAGEREAARRIRVSRNVTDINKLFFTPEGDRTAERDEQLLDVENRIRDRFLPDFQDQTTDANRELRFALSRRGLGGGSAEIDAGERLSDRVAKGERAIGEKVIIGRNENERLNQNIQDNLIAQANADADRESIFSNIGTKQQTAVASSTELGQRDELGNLFVDVGSLFKEINDERAFNRGATGVGGRFASGTGRSLRSFFGKVSNV